MSAPDATRRLDLTLFAVVVELGIDVGRLAVGPSCNDSRVDAVALEDLLVHLVADALGDGLGGVGLEARDASRVDGVVDDARERHRVVALDYRRHEDGLRRVGRVLLCANLELELRLVHCFTHCFSPLFCLLLLFVVGPIVTVYTRPFKGWVIRCIFRKLCLYIAVEKAFACGWRGSRRRSGGGQDS